ncbi:hypothetical protein O3P69_020406 [Scylla paramamosain]|uniref:Uncharacterized protein n=1 Tax=Scylla paramamosain TaxID=85552 RepID=A0AAW0TP01_SCYPA
MVGMCVWSGYALVTKTDVQVKRSGLNRWDQIDLNRPQKPVSVHWSCAPPTTPPGSLTEEVFGSRRRGWSSGVILVSSRGGPGFDSGSPLP